MVHMVSHGAFHMVTILLRSIIFMDEIGQFGYLVVRQKISSQSEVFYDNVDVFCDNVEVDVFSCPEQLNG